VQAAAIPDGKTQLKPRNERELYFYVQCDKGRYFHKEPIEVTFWLENIGKDVEYFWESEALDLVIEDSLGRRLTSCGQWMRSMPVIYTDSAKGVSSAELLELSAAEHTERFPQDILSRLSFGRPFACVDIPIGNYRIYGERFKTDTAYVSVIAPNNDPDRSALALFLQSEIVGQRSSRFEVARNRQILLQVHEDYPQSYLMPRVLGVLLDAAGDTSAMAAQELIMNHPTSSHAAEALPKLKLERITDDERASVKRGLEALLQTFEGSNNLSKLIELRLLEIEE